MLIKHARWRVGPDGADTQWSQNKFQESPLNYEFFWMDEPDQNGCPTLVARTFVHDGAHYNEDPKVFTQVPF